MPAPPADSDLQPPWVRYFDREPQGRLLLLGCLLLATMLLGYAQLRCQDLSYSEDETRNAVTGVYFADLMTDRPLSHPVEYTYRYYAQYPALGLIHWPPFFHLVEGGMFLLAGRSLETARLTVLLFMLVGLVFWFKLVRALLNPVAAAFSTVMLALTPSLFYFTQAVLLGVPALALCLGAAYFWIRCLQTEDRSLLYRVAVLSSLALLTAPQAIPLLPLFILTLLVERKWSLVLNWTWVRAFALSAVLLVPYYALAARVHGRTLAAHVVERRAYRLADFTYYWRVLPGELGWPLLLLAASGVIMLFFQRSRRGAVWMLLWIVACYLSLSLLAARDPRYAFTMLPPLIYFASWPLAIAVRTRRTGALGLVACGLLLVVYGFAGVTGRFRQLTGAIYGSYAHLSGYSALARRLTQAPGSGEVVLVDDLNAFSGNLIFYMRAYDSQRRFVILTKALYVTNIIRFYGSRELLHTPEDLRELMAAYGIKHIVVSDHKNYGFPIQGVLRELLQGPQFKLVGRFPMVTDQTSSAQQDLLLYENVQAAAPTAKYLDLKMLTLGRDIVVPLADLGIR